MIARVLFTLSFVSLVLTGSTRGQPIERIAFGGCANQKRPQPIWEAVVAAEPDLFIFNGDNIYGDTEDMAVMRAKYAQLAAMPGFAQLRQITTILATWDDHDYGLNDGGADYPQRVASQREFIQFFDLPADSPVHNRPGIYDAHTFGPPGKRVQVILLDTRYFRSPLSRRSNEQRKRLRLGPFRATTDTTTTMLGEPQWKWLEQQLRQPAEVRIIVSSVQVVSTQHGWETWGNFPHERRRLFDLIAATDAGGVIFISGDRHMAEISRTDEGPYPLHDFTASGINMSDGGRPDEPNPFRLIPMYRRNNFGMIELIWEPDPIIRLSARNTEGEIMFDHTIYLDDLRRKAAELSD